MPSEADEIVAGTIAKWSAGFGKLDAAAIASLYSKSAFFFGSNPTLYRGREGVTAYFTGLPRWSAPTVQFTDVKTEQVTDAVINMAATASFMVEPGASPLVVKITWVFIREDGDWKIVQHHVSPTAPLLER